MIFLLTFRASEGSDKTQLIKFRKPMSSYMEMQACWHLVAENKGHKMQTKI